MERPAAAGRQATTTEATTRGVRVRLAGAHRSQACHVENGTQLVRDANCAHRRLRCSRSWCCGGVETEPKAQRWPMRDELLAAVARVDSGADPVLDDPGGPIPRSRNPSRARFSAHSDRRAEVREVSEVEARAAHSYALAFRGLGTVVENQFWWAAVCLSLVHCLVSVWVCVCARTYE